MDWVSKRRVSGLNGGGIGYKYKAYGIIKRSNQLFNGKKMQVNTSDISSYLHYIQRGYEELRLYSHISDKHING